MKCRIDRFSTAVFAGILIVGLLTIASAEIPGKINYQGRLTDTATGEPLAGPQSMVFRIYDASEDGSELWSETQTVTPDSMGVISVILGHTNPITTIFDGPIWLEVEVDGEILTPRREIVSVPFAFRAAASDSLGGFDAGDYALVNHEHDYGDGHSLDAEDGDPVDVVYVDESGNVGVGTAGPGALLHVFDGSAGAGSPAGGSELVIEDDGNARINLLTPNDAYPGLTFGDPEDSEAGKIIYSHGSDHMRFVTDGTDRVTITGEGDVGIGTTVPDERLDVTGTIKAASGDTAAVIGETTVTEYIVNHGGYFSAREGQGSGVFAEGNLYGVSAVGNVAVRAISKLMGGFGVYGNATAGGTGVGGYASNNYSVGVNGNSSGTMGCSGISGGVLEDHHTNYGIHGTTFSNPNSYAGYFEGRVRVTGYLDKAGGGFLIDHPDDPENRILRHSFVESPEMVLIYKGRASLQEGATTVELPGYFEGLAHPDGREIVLTCVGGYSPLYLDGDIADGRFTVRSAGGAADQEFSWIVYAVRNDAWAQQHRFPVEEDKTPYGEFKPGGYLNPRAFGVEIPPEEFRGPVPPDELSRPGLPDGVQSERVSP
jgi:hypothetical protein